MTTAHASMTFAIALVAGVLAQSLAKHLRIPGIILLLAIGGVLGPEGFDWVHPDSIGGGLFDLVDLAVAVILFEGGLNLEASRLRRQETPIRRLITWGALITLGGAIGSAMLFLHWPLSLAALFGSLVVVTGPTVVAPLIRDLRLRPGLKTVIEAEGVLIDPIGAILAILVLHIVLAPGAETFASELYFLSMRLGFGILAGLSGGLIIGWLLRVRGLVPQGHENIFTLALVYFLFQAADHIISHSGILAVTVAGILVGNMGTQVDRDLREFKDQLTVMFVGLLFILLSADIRWGDMIQIGWPAVWINGALILVVRPLSVLLSTYRSGLALREQLFLAWVAPRGIVAAAMATLTADAMLRQHISGGEELRAMVFLTIAVTVVHAGTTARLAAWLLNLQLPGRNAVAILGAHGLGLALAHELHTEGIPTVFLDADPKRCREAQEAGFTVVFGDALQERTLQRAHFEVVDKVIGLTANEHLNCRFVAQARMLFKVPTAYVAVEALNGTGESGPLRQIDAEVLFEGPHDTERWDVRWRHGDVEVIRCLYDPPEEKTPSSDKPAEPPATPHSLGEHGVILTIHDGKRIFPMWLGYQPKAGEHAAVAVFKPQRDEAITQLGAAGWVIAPPSEPEDSPAPASLQNPSLA
ncbi:MAG: sodium:proton antiporter [Nitrospira sp.]|nr:cation:proton antiporter [Nitrospira sp.]